MRHCTTTNGALRLACLCLITLLPGFNNSTHAAEFSPGNMLVTYGNSIYEYSLMGDFIQSIPVPYPNPPRPSYETVRDVIMTSDGRAACFNGTFTPFMSMLNSETYEWEHLRHPDFHIPNNGNCGGIAAWRQYVFAGELSNDHTEPLRAIVRYDISNNTSQRFTKEDLGADSAGLLGLADLTIGLDGKLYGITEYDEKIVVIDPDTMLVDRIFELPYDYRGIAVDEEGNIFTATYTGFLHKFDADGNVLDQLFVGIEGFPVDIDLAPDGTIIVGTTRDAVIVTNSEFSSLTRWSVGSNLSNTFVSFTSYIPEPASGLLLAILGFCASVRRGGR